MFSDMSDRHDLSSLNRSSSLQILPPDLGIIGCNQELPDPVDFSDDETREFSEATDIALCVCRARTLLLAEAPEFKEYDASV